MVDLAQFRRQWHPRHDPLRQLPRICIPGAALARLIIRVAEATAIPLALAGPALGQQLQRHAERLSDTTICHRAGRPWRGAVLWLLAAPESAPEAKDLCDPLLTTSQGDDPEPSALLPETQKLFLEDFAVAKAALASGWEEPVQESQCPHQTSARGAR